MSTPIIRVENLSKSYRLGAIGSRTLRDDLARWWAQLRGQPDPLLRIGQTAHAHLEGETLWALRDVSFEVQPGEVLGIIGRNGAGKSTLLKILSRVTAPTSGQVKVQGRIASLLEVGTGFNPELTGRENIYLNGAILGMKRREIVRQFDEIVAFSGVEEFVDTPVKRYSSGMYVRLAFAVAAHLEPEILIVDEVLAVGDVEFQKKCLGKMGEVAQGGRTVLFVSHNMGAIQRLCSRAALVDHGQLKTIGATTVIVHDYLGLLAQDDLTALRENAQQALTLSVRVLNQAGTPTMLWPFGEPIVVEVVVATTEPLQSPAIDLGFYTGARVGLFAVRSDQFPPNPPTLTGLWRVRFEIANPGLTAAEIVFDVGLREGRDGRYRKLISNAGSLSADQHSLPELAETHWLLFPQAQVHWQAV